MAVVPEAKATGPASVSTQQGKHSHKHRHLCSSPFDPEELSRKLTIIQAEQRLMDEKTRCGRIGTDQKTTIQSPKEWRVGTKHHDLAHEFPHSGKTRFLSANTVTKPVVDQCQSEPIHHTIATDFETSCIMHGLSGQNGDDGCPSNYRHIPQVAALQFARTTTTDGPGEKSLVHRLSRMALKYHMDGVNTDTGFHPESCTTAPCETTKSFKKAQRKREKQYQRNQFQHPSAMLPIVEFNDNVTHPVHKSPFETNLSPKSLESDEESATGVPMERLASKLHAEMHDNPHYEGLTEAEIAEHRVDWTQSDEANLRKSESKWRLKRHLGPQRYKDGQGFPFEEESTTEDQKKSFIADLLPRLKRHSDGDRL